jgi:hypothetical protein
MIKLFVPLGLMVIGWIVFMIFARRNEKNVQAEWQTLLSPASEKTFLQTRHQIERNSSMVGVAITEAMEIRKLGDLDEAIRFLDTGSDVIERFTPNLLSLLKVMIKFSRMMSAVTPVDPVLPQNFHLAELTNLAQLNRILHQILMSTKQRFRLKLYILGKGVRIASHYLLQSIKNVVTHRSAVDQEWEEVTKIGQDFQKLSNESVQSFRSLLEALSTDAAKELARALYLPEESHTPMRNITPSSSLPSPHDPALAALPVQEVGARSPSHQAFGTV